MTTLDRQILIRRAQMTLAILEAPFGASLVEAAREPGQDHTVEEWIALLKAEISELRNF